MRKAQLHRQPPKREIRLALTIDGAGKYQVRPASGFSITCWSCSRGTAPSTCTLDAHGDLDVDQHHTVEDLGIALGEAVSTGARRPAGHQPRRLLRDADGRNAGRRGDRSRRPAARGRRSARSRSRRVGDLQTELVHDFFEGFAIGARANVHVKVLYGRSSHHKIEAVFKAFARALRVACARDKRLARMLPSTKGLL